VAHFPDADGRSKPGKDRLERAGNQLIGGPGLIASDRPLGQTLSGLMVRREGMDDVMAAWRQIGSGRGGDRNERLPCSASFGPRFQQQVVASWLSRGSPPASPQMRDGRQARLCNACARRVSRAGSAPVQQGAKVCPGGLALR